MLVTPPLAAADNLAATLAQAMEAGDVAAVIVRLAEGGERERINIVKTLSKDIQDRGAALILDGAPELTARAGADGAHLTGTEAFERDAPSLKPDRIAGAGGLESRHDAMLAAERNADYVMFGEPDTQGERPSLEAIVERVEWWAEVFQTPCVAYAAAAEEIDTFSVAGADFIALDPALWVAQPQKSIADALERMQQPEGVA
jgi:thiamine-phosphate pyrophosphorylase